jgi:hypothetical protein
MSAMMSAESAAAVTAQRETGEKDRANDEHHAGDDRHPGSSPIDAGRPVFVRLRVGCGCRFLLKCFSHVAILTAAV